MGLVSRFRDALRQEAPLPPVASSIELRRIADDEVLDAVPEEAQHLLPISAFACVIEYQGDLRLITCRRHDIKEGVGYVGAICHSARGYRQFRTDRITSVIDPTTGEVLGDGRFFERFEAESTSGDSNWGLSRSRKATLIAGLNVLAFMARCDGRWHPLETEPVENFVTTMWLRKEWDGDPPIDAIVGHARLLAPDADTALRGLKYFTHSRGSMNILRSALIKLIAADGVICEAETEWMIEIDDLMETLRDREFEQYSGFGPLVRITGF